MRPEVIHAFWLLEFLKVWSDLTEKCMACELPWYECFSCEVTDCEREIEEWLRY